MWASHGQLRVQRMQTDGRTNGAPCFCQSGHWLDGHCEYIDFERYRLGYCWPTVYAQTCKDRIDHIRVKPISALCGKEGTNRLSGDWEDAQKAIHFLLRAPTLNETAHLLQIPLQWGSPNWWHGSGQAGTFGCWPNPIATSTGLVYQKVYKLTLISIKKNRPQQADRVPSPRQDQLQACTIGR